MQKTIDETNRRREMQIGYNNENGLTPQPIHKKITSSAIYKNDDMPSPQYTQKDLVQKAAEPTLDYSPEELEKLIQSKQKAMEKAAAELDFIQAAEIRDELFALKAQQEVKN